MTREITIKSYGKINLSLDVTNTLDNGMHEVDMIMQGILLHDDVKISYKQSNHWQIYLNTNRAYLPRDNKNIAYKAAEKIIEIIKEKKMRVRPGIISIDIFKRIPVAAGLAGGSGNGSAVLLGLNSLLRLRLSLDQLLSLSSQLGSDVPFSLLCQCYGNKNLPAYLKEDERAIACARATSTGIKLKTISPPLNSFLVIAKPNISVSTAEVYKNIDDCKIDFHPRNNIMEKGIYTNNFYLVKSQMINVLENYTLKAYPKVEKLKSTMINLCGKNNVLMSGSGPSIFALCKTYKQATTTADKLLDLGYEVHWTRTLSHKAPSFKKRQN